jgi:hypothetical protein
VVLFMAGYSKRFLFNKLGIKSGFKMAVVNSPENYFKMLGPLPHPIQVMKKPGRRMNLIHFFTKSRAEYQRKFAGLKKSLVSDGMLWVSWPKATSRVPTDMSDNVVRDFALKNGLVDIKVCAIDATWSGLKLVIPLKDREGKR